MHLHEFAEGCPVVLDNDAGDTLEVGMAHALGGWVGDVFSGVFLVVR